MTFDFNDIIIPEDSPSDDYTLDNEDEETSVMSKSDELRKWLKSNPGKTKRDWLLEVRCPNENQRKQFQEFLTFCDENGIELIIPSASPLKEIIMGHIVQYDFAIKEYGAVYDLDAPDELYTGKHGHNEAGWIPFLKWKWQQILNTYNPTRTTSEGPGITKEAPGSYQYGDFPPELEKEHPQFVNTFCYKWNHPEVLVALKKFFDRNKNE